MIVRGGGERPAVEAHTSSPRQSSISTRTNPFTAP